ncbi:hypothetical protein SLA2020_489260 [Shorea laevis]
MVLQGHVASTFWSVIMTWVYGYAFVSERNTFKKLKLQSWVIPRYKIEFLQTYIRRKDVSKLIEEAVFEADKKGVKVLSLGLLNQKEELNMNGELYIQWIPQLRIKIVDGSSLVAASVIHSIPKETARVIFRGKLSKVAYAVVSALCQKGIQVNTLHKDEYMKKLHSKDMVGGRWTD